MTYCHNISKIETVHITTQKKIETEICWVSHGNYAIIQPKNKYFDNYIELEEEYFNQIIEAFETKESNDKPFWSVTPPSRGWLFVPCQLKAFFCGNGFMLKSFISLKSDGPFDKKFNQIELTLEDFKKIRDLALNLQKKPVHCVSLG